MRISCLPGGSSSRMLISRSPYKIKPSVRGIGVALITIVCTSSPFSASCALCLTPKRCCSSVITRARFLNATSFCINACVPIINQSHRQTKLFLFLFSLLPVLNLLKGEYLYLPGQEFLIGFHNAGWQVFLWVPS